MITQNEEKEMEILMRKDGKKKKDRRENNLIMRREKQQQKFYAKLKLSCWQRNNFHYLLLSQNWSV